MFTPLVNSKVTFSGNYTVYLELSRCNLTSAISGEGCILFLSSQRESPRETLTISQELRPGVREGGARQGRAGQGGGGGWAAQHSTGGQGGRGVKSTSPNTPEPEDVKATFCPAIHSFEVKRRADVYLPIPVSG